MLTEVLAPAGSMASLTAALRCGADAVYVGAKQFSARAHAENFSPEELAEAARLCHLYGTKLYLAVNTLLRDSEFPALDALLRTLAETGADGCIVQDLGAAAYIAARLPEMPLHASTQLTIHTPAGIRFAKKAGFCRAVLARELSYEQMKTLCAEAARIGMETEVFVHGAHCMSVSGQCMLSAAMGGRSANRGCCAQPCRLPFTANADRTACALSLKDQSLLAHLGQLCQLGVTSLKIEGRMKRPEYVAAAVTACRSALAGEAPDLETLRAVFSRSGFTDGYFTGKRQAMFGTRQKEDVTAAQNVLAPLRSLFRNPRKTAEITAEVTLRAGEPARLSLTERGGASVTVTGDIPKPAQGRPTDAEQLAAQLGKLGGTVYTLREAPVTDIAPGLTLPVSAVNALRRAGTAALDAARIARNTPQYTLQEIPAKPQEQQNPPLSFRLQIRRLSQLKEIAEFAPETASLLLPLRDAEQYAAGYAAGRFPVPPERVQLLTPRFCCDEQTVTEKLKAAQDLGFQHLACQSVGDLARGRELGFTLHGTLGLHISNARAAAVLSGYGVQDALCSPEFRGVPAVLPLGVYAYGRLPLMLMRNCPVREQLGCSKCRHRLTDRKGAAVYCDCTRFCAEASGAPDYAELFNAVPVWLADRPQEFSRAAYALLSMTDETPERVRAVLAAYLRGTDARPPQFTRGIRLTE